MPIAPRFEEICQLLLQGTDNGSLEWSSFSDTATVTTRLGGNLFTVSANGPFGEDLPRDEVDQIYSTLTLRVLNSNGDELDSINIRNHTDGFEKLLALFNKASQNRDRLLSTRLQPVTEALRAAVLAGSGRR
jgi:hypothetical protein